MPLAPGTKFGPYEIVAPIGAGGMGEVYRARDTRLDRSVALKILPAEFADDAQLRSRFEREARAISQLEHPNICRLYDVGEGYLVMELLDGETLAQRIARGPLPVTEAVRLAIQIADALDRAHRRGIVHRDLKPGNVMLTKSGAKLLDFGLARTIPSESGPDHPTEAIEHRTAQHTVVGTTAYMSPEQASGEDLDARSDIFAFGIVLQEMVTGLRPFGGRSAATMMHAIVHDEPVALDADRLPAALVEIIRRCLAKDRDDRFQSAADLAFALSTVRSASSTTIAPVARRSPKTKWIFACATIVVIAASMLTGWWWSRRTATPERIVSFKITFPPKTPLMIEPMAISPDGSTIAYVRSTDGTNRLYLRSLSSLDDTIVENSTGARGPFFSADGTSIAFASDGALKRLRLGERDPVIITKARGISGGTWGADGTIVYVSETTGTLFRLSDSGSSPQEITKLDGARRETAHFGPQFLPDGHTLLFMSRVGFGTDSRVRIEALNLVDGRRRSVLEEKRNGSAGIAPIQGFQWLDDVLLFVSEGRLNAVRFEPAQASVTSAAVAVIGGLPIPVMSAGQFAVSRNGTLIHVSDLASPTELIRIRAAANDERLRLPEASCGFLAISPDERQLALTTVDQGVMIVQKADLDRHTISPFGPEGIAHIAIWTPDGTHVIYSFSDGGPSNMVSMRADGSGTPETIIASPNHQDPASISPDGKWLAYAERDPVKNWDIWIVPLAAPRTRRAWLQTAAAEYSPAISPDGRSIAYVQRMPGGAAQIFVDSFPEPSQRTYLGDGQYPIWSSNGESLYYLVNNRVLAVAMKDGAAAAPRVVADGVPMPAGFGIAPYAPMKDGSLLVLRRTIDPSLTVVMNLGAELKKLVTAR